MFDAILEVLLEHIGISIVAIILGILLFSIKYVVDSIKNNSIREKVSHMTEMQGADNGLYCSFCVKKLPQECRLLARDKGIYKKLVEETVSTTTRKFFKNDTNSVSAFHQNNIYKHISLDGFFYYRLLIQAEEWSKKGLVHIGEDTYRMDKYLGKDSTDTASLYTYTEDGYAVEKIIYACCYLLKDETYRDEKFHKQKVIQKLPELPNKDYVWKVWR